jgi:hypothetical protein
MISTFEVSILGQKHSNKYSLPKKHRNDDTLRGKWNAGKLRTWLKLFRGFDQVAATKGLASFKCCSHFQRIRH